jgi:hypothetical protein
MAAHRDHIYAATGQRSLIVGPLEWSKLLFPHDGTGNERDYASYELASSTEHLRVVDATLRAGAQAYALGSGSRSTPEETRVLAALRERYRLVTLVDEHDPYDLRIEQIVPR